MWRWMWNDSCVLNQPWLLSLWRASIIESLYSVYHIFIYIGRRRWNESDEAVTIIDIWCKNDESIHESDPWYECQSKRKPLYSGPMYHPSIISVPYQYRIERIWSTESKILSSIINHQFSAMRILVTGKINFNLPPRTLARPTANPASPGVRSFLGRHVLDLLVARGHSVTAVVNLRTALLLKKMYPCLSSDKLDFAINDSILGPYGTWESSMGRPVSWPCYSLPQSRHLQSSLRSCNPYSRSYVWRTHQPQRM